MNIVVDVREKKPFEFSKYDYPDIQVSTGKLQTADYSLLGMENIVGVERKSLPDLIQCLSHERDRFERELARAMGLRSFMVVVEADWQSLVNGKYNSGMNPRAAAQSVISMQSRWKTAFFFAGSRQEAENVTASFLRHFLRSAERSLKNILKNHGQDIADAV